MIDSEFIRWIDFSYFVVTYWQEILGAILGIIFIVIGSYFAGAIIAKMHE